MLCIDLNEIAKSFHFLATKEKFTAKIIKVICLYEIQNNYMNIHQYLILPQP